MEHGANPVERNPQSGAAPFAHLRTQVDQHTLNIRLRDIALLVENRTNDPLALAHLVSFNDTTIRNRLGHTLALADRRSFALALARDFRLGAPHPALAA